jgi:hypothetical protein
VEAVTRRAVAAVLVALTLPLTVAADCAGSAPAAGTCRTLQHDLDAARTRMNAEQVGTAAYRKARDAYLAVSARLRKARC